MTSGGRANASAETAPGPARWMAGWTATIVLLAVASLVVADPGPLTATLLGGLTLLVGARAIVRLLVPGLTLRLDADGLSYRRHGRWSSIVRQPFVSPWFIGWRGDGWAGFGVFACQLAEDDFRRLARTLRQAGSPLPE